MRTKSDFFWWPAGMLAVLVLALPGCHEGEKEDGPAVPVQALFAKRCTPCHGWEEASSIHGSEETILQLVRRMRGKGAAVTDAEAMSIAGFLSAPSRHVFESRCTACHPLDIVLSAHAKGRMTLETIRKMRKKKGADISAEDAEVIREYLARHYFTTPD